MTFGVTSCLLAESYSSVPVLDHGSLRERQKPTNEYFRTKRHNGLIAAQRLGLTKIGSQQILYDPK